MTNAADQDEANTPSIGFVGAGRLAQTLAAAFVRAGIPVVAASSRDPARRAEFRPLYHNVPLGIERGTLPAARAAQIETLLRAGLPATTR